MKRQWNKTLEAVRLVLQIAKSNQVVHSFLESFNMTVKHRRIRPNAGLVNSTRHFQPAIARHFVSRNQRPRPLCKYFRAATGTTAHSRFTQSRDDPVERLFRDLREEIELDHREGLEVNLWKPFTQADQQIGVIAEGKIRIEPADNVELCERVRVLPFCELE